MPDRKSRADVAIVGMACLFPAAPDLRSFWQNIVDGVDAISDPVDWGDQFVCDPESSASDCVYTRRGGYLGDLLRFDPAAFGVMPRAVDGGEPEHFVALTLARDALADAGYLDREFPRHRTGIILGRGTYVNRGMIGALQHSLVIDQTLRLLGDLDPRYGPDELAVIKEKLRSSLPPFNAETAQSLAHSAMCGRIANRLDLMGPAYTIDAACASSLIAVDLGMKELSDGSCDLVLAGGIQISTTFPIAALFCQLGALSRSGRLRPFHPKADGTLLGEGAGMVLLKRLQDAERDSDRIYAVVRELGVSSDGRGMGVLAPRVEGEELALRRAYEETGISPESVGLIEAHGTGTQAGDAAELEALRRVFGPRRGALPTCALGSVKSMIGHSIPAAGAAGIIKAALALHHKILPPTLHGEVPHPALEDTSIYVNPETRPWIHGGAEPRRAGVNAFGFGGINAHAVLEEYTDEATHGVSVGFRVAGESELIVLEGATVSELIERCGSLGRLLEGWSDPDLPAIATALADARTGTAPACLAIVAESRQDLRAKLASAVEALLSPDRGRIDDSTGIYYSSVPLAPAGGVAFLFPGAGSGSPGTMADLCLAFEGVRECFDRMDRMFSGPGLTPAQIAFPPPGYATPRARSGNAGEADGDLEAELAASLGLHALLGTFGIHPDAVAGEPGGCAALLAAGAVAPGEEARFLRNQMRAHRSADQAPERDAPASCFDEVEFAAPGPQLYSCVTAAPVAGEPEAIRRLAAESLTLPERWRDTIERMYADGVRIFVEVGTQGNLFSLVEEALSECPHLAVRASAPGRPEITQLHHLLGRLAAHGVPVELGHLHVGRERTLSSDDLWSGEAPAVPTPHDRPPRLQTALPLLRLEESELRELPALLEGHRNTVPELSTRTEKQEAMSDRAKVMEGYFRTMESFLASQEAVMRAFLASHRGEATRVEEVPLETMPRAAQPFEADARAIQAGPAAATPPAIVAGDEAPTKPPTKALDADALMSLLLRVISEKTGYPEDLLAPDADLEADLGIDSIKRVEILGALGAENGGIVFDVEELSQLRTLGAITEVLKARL